MKRLSLHLKGEYFDAIKDGSKTEEFRLYNDYWKQRLIDKTYDGIVLYKGYPKRGDKSKILERPWRGWTIKEITHPHFGDDPVTVFSIKVNER